MRKDANSQEEANYKGSEWDRAVQEAQRTMRLPLRDDGDISRAHMGMGPAPKGPRGRVLFAEGRWALGRYTVVASAALLRPNGLRGSMAGWARAGHHKAMGVKWSLCSLRTKRKVESRPGASSAYAGTGGKAHPPGDMTAPARCCALGSGSVRAPVQRRRGSTHRPGAHC
ncbi:hypothetical protein VUR80DRAFT_5812 [Thermomyces stellatus]